MQGAVENELRRVAVMESRLLLSPHLIPRAHLQPSHPTAPIPFLPFSLPPLLVARRGDSTTITRGVGRRRESKNNLAQSVSRSAGRMLESQYCRN